MALSLDRLDEGGGAALIVAIERVVVGHLGFDRPSSVSEVARTSAAWRPSYLSDRLAPDNGAPAPGNAARRDAVTSEDRMGGPHVTPGRLPTP